MSASRFVGTVALPEVRGVEGETPELSEDAGTLAPVPGTPTKFGY